jgi:hypothetical protein
MLECSGLAGHKLCIQKTCKHVQNVDLCCVLGMQQLQGCGRWQQKAAAKVGGS